MQPVVKTSQQIAAGDVWAGKSNAERKAWLKKAGCPVDLDTTTFESLSDDVQLALSQNIPQ